MEAFYKDHGKALGSCFISSRKFLEDFKKESEKFLLLLGWSIRGLRHGGGRPIRRILSW